MAAAQKTWSSRFGFLMACIGFAVGLGNIWRFPYVTGENGGGAFIVVYLACVFVISLPILIAEIMIGRRGRGSPPGSMLAVAIAEGRPAAWRWVGSMNLLAAFLIVVTYVAVIGWVLHYLTLALVNGFAGFDAAAARAEFAGVQASAALTFGWTLVAVTACGGIIYGGVEGGIERAVRVLMPLLFLLLASLAVFNAFAGGMPETLNYLLAPDFSKLSGPMFLAAVGQAFFSIGVAMAGMMTFGAYLPTSVSIPGSAVLIIIADTVVAIVAGLVVFPAVFHFGLDPAGGPGLIFQTLPLAFAQMPGGAFVAVLFFLLLAVGGITSAVGLMEPLTARMEERLDWSRRRSAVAVTGGVGVLSSISVLGYNHWAEVRLLGADINTVLDFIPNQLLLPLGGLFIALFAGWAMSAATARDELGMAEGSMFDWWRRLLRYLVPPALILILIAGMAG